MKKVILKDLFDDLAESCVFEDNYDFYHPKTIPQICATMKKPLNDILIAIYALDTDATIRFLSIANRVKCLLSMLYITYNDDELTNTYNETIHEILYILPTLKELARTLDLYKTSHAITCVDIALKQFQ